MKTYVEFKASKGIGPGFPFHDGEAAWDAAVAACLAIVSEAECIGCHVDDKQEGFRPAYSDAVAEHDPRCPVALAARIAARGESVEKPKGVGNDRAL